MDKLIRVLETEFLGQTRFLNQAWIDTNPLLRYNASMLAYVVRRASNEGDGPPSYQLFDESADLLYVAQPGAGQSGAAQAGTADGGKQVPTYRHIYFRKPDGTAVASLDLPWTDTIRREGPPQYALIHDDAVYALLTGAGPGDDDGPFRLCSVEVEGQRWTGLQAADEDQTLLSLYEDLSDLSIYGDLEETDLPAPVAVVRTADEDGVFLVEIARGKLIQPGLMALALVLLVDSPAV